MRRISKLTRVAVGVASLALAATACGGTSSESSGGSGEPARAKRASPSRTTSAARATSPSTTPRYAGLEKAKKEFGYKTADIEPTEGETDADKEQRLASLAKQGYNPVIGVGFAYGPAHGGRGQEVSRRPPSASSTRSSRATTWRPWSSPSRRPRTSPVSRPPRPPRRNTVGFVGGVDIPLIHKFEAGYKQGVEDTNAKVKVLSQYLTQTAEEGGFSSPDKGKAAAEGQIEKKADVLYQAAGLSGQGVIEAAAKAKVWAIGVDSDQYNQEALAAYKDYILTSALKDVGGAVYALAKSVEDGKPSPAPRPST